MTTQGSDKKIKKEPDQGNKETKPISVILRTYAEDLLNNTINIFLIISTVTIVFYLQLQQIF